MLPDVRKAFEPTGTVRGLHSDPGSDPIDIKSVYFKWVNTSQPATFRKLPQIAKDHRTSATDIISNMNADHDAKYLARSIVLMWRCAHDLGGAVPIGCQEHDPVRRDSGLPAQDRFVRKLLSVLAHEPNACDVRQGEQHKNIIQRSVHSVFEKAHSNGDIAQRRDLDRAIE